MYNFLLTVLLCSVAFRATEGQNSQCSLAKDCTACMRAGPECYWCEDQNFTASGNLIRPRCNEFNVLSPICSKLRFLNSSITVLKQDEFSSTVQTSPQHIRMKMRPGQTQKFQVTVQPAENFPVDIYMLMDLSRSMQDDLQNINSLSQQIANTIGKITTNYRFGFGSYIDKPTTPFVPVKPINFPCKEGDLTCRPVFGYVHVFDFSNDVAAFTSALPTVISGDIDKPEAPFDALMQASVCEKELRWKTKGASRRIVLILTDALPKIAGDGKTGGIIKPNDEQCHMADRTFRSAFEKYYTESTTMDYPSIKQLKNVMFNNGITPILAVTEDVLPIYKKIAEEWADLGAAADTLSSDSSNIVKLLKDNYEKISTTVTLSDNSPSFINIDYKVDPNSCEQIGDGGQCLNVRLNQSIIFDVSIKLDKCPDAEEKNKNNQMRITTAGFGDILIDLEYQCECNCTKIENSPACNFHGTYECGLCICNPGRFGHLCQCDSSKPSQNETITCVDPKTTDGTLCNGFGQCICGVCECFTQPSPREISGEFCGCKNFNCPRYNQSECGGKERGTCKCGVCECNPPYEERNCGKTNPDVVLTLCKKDGEECSNNGVCDLKLQACKCDVGFIGKHCETCVSPQCKCSIVEECVQCEAQNRTCDEKLNCGFHSYFETNATIKSPCRTLVDGCFVDFNISGDPLKKNESLELLYKFTDLCASVGGSGNDDDPNLLAIILGIIAGILLLGLLLLLLWKLLVTMHDKHEYARFQKSQNNDSQWEKDGNPIYREPNQQFVNPAFAGAM